jgi:hypothetical protein
LYTARFSGKNLPGKGLIRYFFKGKASSPTMTCGSIGEEVPGKGQSLGKLSLPSSKALPKVELDNTPPSL